MKLSTLLEKRYAHGFAKALQVLCYLLLVFMLVSAVLMLLGRMQVDLVTPQGRYENAILLEKDHATTTRLMTMRLSEAKLHLEIETGVGFITWLGVALIGLLRILPLAWCFLLFARFFRNIQEDRVFVPENANLLLRSGIIWLYGVLIWPLLAAFLIPAVVNALSANTLSVSATLNVSGLFVGTILLVSAYIMRYGISLQDEVDHTI